MLPILLPRDNISITTLCCSSQDLACSIGKRGFHIAIYACMLNTLYWRLLDPAVDYHLTHMGKASGASHHRVCLRDDVVLLIQKHVAPGAAGMTPSGRLNTCSVQLECDAARQVSAYLIQGALTRITWPLTGYISGSWNSLAAPRPEQFATRLKPASSCIHFFSVRADPKLSTHQPEVQTA